MKALHVPKVDCTCSYLHTTKGNAVPTCDALRSFRPLSSSVRKNLIRKKKLVEEGRGEERRRRPDRSSTETRNTAPASPAENLGKMPKESRWKVTLVKTQKLLLCDVLTVSKKKKKEN